MLTASTLINVAKHAAAVTVMSAVDVKDDGTCNGGFAMLVPTRDATTKEHTVLGAALAAEWRQHNVEYAVLFVAGPGEILPRKPTDDRDNCAIEIRHGDELIARVRPGTELHGSFEVHGTTPVMTRLPVAEGQTVGELVPSTWEDGVTPKLRLELVAKDVQIVRTGPPASEASAFSVNRS